MQLAISGSHLQSKGGAAGGDYDRALQSAGGMPSRLDRMMSKPGHCKMKPPVWVNARKRKKFAQSFA
jgi:hypothetical protein